MVIIFSTAQSPLVHGSHRDDHPFMPQGGMSPQ
jgi:hypothetical protein